MPKEFQGESLPTFFIASVANVIKHVPKSFMYGRFYENGVWSDVRPLIFYKVDPRAGLGIS